MRMTSKYRIAVASGITLAVVMTALAAVGSKTFLAEKAALIAAHGAQRAGVPATNAQDNGSVTAGLDSGSVIASTQSAGLEMIVPTASGHFTPTSGGRLVSIGSTFDTVVEPTASGLRAFSIINGASAPTEYEYTYPGADFKQLPSGEIAIARGDQLVGTVSPPWAVDANGKSVPTSYSVTGHGSLVQTVAHGGAAYPVVADPSVSLGWYVYVRWSKDEVRDLQPYWNTVSNFAEVQCAPFAYLKLPWGVAACIYAVSKVVPSIKSTLQAAYNNYWCFEEKWTYNAILVGWRAYPC